MKYLPLHKPAKEILITLGFVSGPNRGYILERKQRHADSSVRAHALIDLDGTIDLHEDYLEEGKHYSKKFGGKVQMLIKYCEEVDNGKEPKISKNMRKKFFFERKPKSQRSYVGNTFIY